MPKAASRVLVAGLIACALSGQPAQTCPAKCAPAQGTPADRATLLADSELHYEASGGIAGFVSGATIRAVGGTVTVEHRPATSRPGTAPESGTLTESEYLELWDEVERAGLWSVKGEPPPRGGADMIQYELGARVGERTVQVRWTEAAMSPGARMAGRIGSHIVDAARRAVAPLR